MAEEQKKGVIVEFDFAAMNGADLLYRVAEAVLAKGGVPFDTRLEALYLAGGNLQGGLADYFAETDTRLTAANAADDIASGFRTALNAAVPQAVTSVFKGFVQKLAGKDLTVVIATRAGKTVVEAAFADLLGDNVTLYQETATTYGSVKWDAWRRACAANRLRNLLTVAVTGSGYGVKSALLAGMPSLAVVTPHVAYQDFGGADETVAALDEAAADLILKILRVN